MPTVIFAQQRTERCGRSLITSGGSRWHSCNETRSVDLKFRFRYQSMHRFQSHFWKERGWRPRLSILTVAVEGQSRNRWTQILSLRYINIVEWGDGNNCGILFQTEVRFNCINANFITKFWCLFKRTNVRVGGDGYGLITSLYVLHTRIVHNDNTNGTRNIHTNHDICTLHIRMCRLRYHQSSATAMIPLW